MPKKSTWEPEPRPDTKEAWRLEKALQEAVADGDTREALSLLQRIAELAKRRPWCGVVATHLTALGRLGRIAGRNGVPAIAELAGRVQELAEPWFAADRDGFSDVAYDARHLALHDLMCAAARAGDLDLALVIRRADDAGNARGDVRWARDYPPEQAAPAFLPSAWGTRNLIKLMVEGRHFDAVPELLGNLNGFLDAAVALADREDQETRDALGEAEAESLACLLSVEELPPDLQARCHARLTALDALAVPPCDWPRTREQLAAVVGPTRVH